MEVAVNRSQWPRSLRRKFASARLLALWDRIEPRPWMTVSRECSVLSGTGLYDGPITRPEKSHRVCVCVCARICLIVCVRAYH